MKWLWYLFFSSMVFNACEKEQQIESVTPQHEATLIITVKYNNNGVMKPLAGVSAFLYLTEYDRMQNQNIRFTGAVNDSGKVVFTSLPDDYYFIIISHPLMGFKTFETATPDRSVSYEEVNF